jgi:hypothetical protein
VLALVTLLAGLGWPRDEFDAAKWRAAPEGERYRQVNDLISSNILLGRNSTEVTALLGKPDPGADSSMQSYVVKIGGSGFDQVFILDIRFGTSGRVEKAFIRGK